MKDYYVVLSFDKDKNTIMNVLESEYMARKVMDKMASDGYFDSGYMHLTNEDFEQGHGIIFNTSDYYNENKPIFVVKKMYMESRGLENFVKVFDVVGLYDNKRNALNAITKANKKNHEHGVFYQMESYVLNSDNWQNWIV